MTPPRIALIGSCATRDVWTLAGRPASTLAAFVGRTSLVSLTPRPGETNPLAGHAPRAEVQDKFAHRAVRTELEKSALSQISHARPDTLVFDFIDERFDLLAAGSVLLNESLDLIEAAPGLGLELSGLRRIPRLSEEAWHLWQAGLLRLREALEDGTLPACRLVLHACLWAREMDHGGRRDTLPDESEILAGRYTSAAAHIALLDRMHAAFLACFPQAQVIEVPAHLRTADAGHRWGPAPFHFIPGYYTAFAHAMAAIGVPLWHEEELAACSGE